MLPKDIMSGRVGLTKENKLVQKIGAFHQLENENLGFQGKRTRDKCSVDIIVPFHGCYELVRRLLLSIVQKTRSNPYLVTLVDDGSPGAAADEFANIIRQAPQTQILRLEKQEGFGNAINAALKITQQPYVCVVHSDCEVKHMGWLEKMGEALVLHKSDDVRLVVPLSDNPGELHIDSAVPVDDFQTPENQITIADNPLPMYCFMCHRVLFDRIGPIHAYPYTWYENEEFFYRMKYYGFKQAIANESWIHHEGSATVNYILRNHKNPKEIESEMEANKQRCITELRALYAKSK
jgi:GT2 family glycosyltransferase